MTVLCPSGHHSSTADYCDQCGVPIVTNPPPPQPTDVLPVIEEADTDTSPAARHEPCPACGAPRSGDDRFCEGCGLDFLAPPAATVTWEAIATADLEQFKRFPAVGVTFPADFGERRFRLDGHQLRIGRSRGGESSLEIDLAGATEDPGISRLHACLERQDDGTYTVRDLGSTNGTTLNDKPVGTDEAVPVASGDRIRVGAWTTITVRSG